MHTHGIHPDALELGRLLERSWPDISAGIARSGVPTCEVVEKTSRERLEEVKASLATARDERVPLEKARNEAREAYANQAGGPSTDSDEFKEAMAAVAALGSKDDEIADLSKEHEGLLAMHGETPEASRNRPAGNAADPRGDDWNADRLLADPKIRESLERIARSPKQRFGGISLGEIVGRDALAAEIAGTENMRRSEYLGVVPQLRRMLRVLDLFPKGTMDGNHVPYTQESGSFDTAAETAEGATKPEGALTLTDTEAKAKTIAHWQKVPKQLLEDFAALKALIEVRLKYGVERRLEKQLLNGKGEGEELLGILNTSGIGSVAFTAGALVTDQVLKAITSVLLADAQATGIVLHPTDWQTALLAKAAGDGHYFSGGPFQVTPQVMWGVPLVASASVPKGTALVGDYEIGTQLLIRSGVEVLMSDSDQDDFVKNRATLLGEMRAALPVFRPPAFAKAALE